MDQNSDFSLRSIIMMLLFSLVILVGAYALDQNQRVTKVVFCDVGNGDAAYIRTRDGIDILIDAGKSRDVLDCLGREMPWYDRNIELAMISHPHIDHYGGFEGVYDVYSLDVLVIPTASSSAQTYGRVLNDAQRSSSVIRTRAGETIRISPDVSLYVLWPPASYYKPDDPNANSYVMIFSDRQNDILFTGDATPDVLSEIAKDPVFDTADDIEILKVPHHGSYNGLTDEFLAAVNPELSVISVGAENNYGHPSKRVLGMFDKRSEPYLTTAGEGSIVIIFGDNEWSKR